MLSNILKIISFIYKAFPKRFDSISAWVSVSYGVLPILCCGLLWVLISRTGSSGAVLVGCTVISQALLQIWPMVGYVGGRKSRVQIEIETLNPNVPGIQAFRGYDPSKAFNRLELIALEHEINFPQPNGEKQWLKELTISRVYLSLEWCIVVCAVIGTLVWAYGPSA